MHQLARLLPIRVSDRPKWPVGGIAERDDPPAVPVRRKAQDFLCLRLVHHAGLTAADAERGRGQHDGHGDLTEVVLHDLTHPLSPIAIGVLRIQECDRGGSLADPGSALPGLRQAGDD